MKRQMQPAAVRPPEPAPPAPHAPSFARRHPILTGFGILAGVSLFAAYFPISAIVTAVAVGAHATGADRIALRGAERAGRWLVRRLPRRKNPVPAPPEPGPAGPQVRRRRMAVPAVGVRRPSLGATLRSPKAVAKEARRRSPSVAAGRELDL